MRYFSPEAFAFTIPGTDVTRTFKSSNPDRVAELLSELDALFGFAGGGASCTYLLSNGASQASRDSYANAAAKMAKAINADGTRKFTDSQILDECIKVLDTRWANIVAGTVSERGPRLSINETEYRNVLDVWFRTYLDGLPIGDRPKGKEALAKAKAEYEDRKGDDIEREVNKRIAAAKKAAA